MLLGMELGLDEGIIEMNVGLELGSDEGITLGIDDG